MGRKVREVQILKQDNFVKKKKKNVGKALSQYARLN